MQEDFLCEVWDSIIGHCSVCSVQCSSVKAFQGRAVVTCVSRTVVLGGFL